MRSVLPAIALWASDPVAAQGVGLYRIFEREIENTKAYANKFADVELRCRYSAPGGRQTDFIGFFDGDGNGGGDKANGRIWKLRFMPDEPGEWRYAWTWSDGSAGGQGTFTAITQGAGKGVLRPYAKNPRWFAYNGTEPVHLKSYYESGSGSLAQPLDWIVKNVYQPLVDNGYNHLQVNWLMPMCCDHAYYHDADAPPKSKEILRLYEEGKASSTMQLDVWRMLESHARWLNDRNVGLHMFLGFDGSRNGGPAWEKLSEAEKDFYVRYVVARLGAFANIAGWNFVWEVEGSRTTHELGWARLIRKYDVFNHLRTYEDETPKTHEYARPEYTFAAVENHLMFSDANETDRPYWRQAWTHHQAALAGYVPGKPVFMSEGNALWRRYWAAKVGATQDDLRQAAWGTVMGGASFTWCGHSQSPVLVAKGPEGIPYHGDDNPYRASARSIDLLSRVMTREVEFHRMTPQDSLLSSHDPRSVWCLAETGRQYLVFAAQGKPFTLDLAPGRYAANQWIDSKTGSVKTAMPFESVDRTKSAFNPPDTHTDWVLLLRESSPAPLQRSRKPETRRSRHQPTLYSIDGRKLE